MLSKLAVLLLDQGHQANAQVVANFPLGSAPIWHPATVVSVDGGPDNGSYTYTVAVVVKNVGADRLTPIGGEPSDHALAVGDQVNFKWYANAEMVPARIVAANEGNKKTFDCVMTHRELDPSRVRNSPWVRLFVHTVQDFCWAPFWHQQLLLQTQDADPRVVTNAAPRFVLDAAGMLSWFKTYGFTGICRAMTCMDYPDVKVEGCAVFDVGQVMKATYPVDVVRVCVASNLSPSTWTKIGLNDEASNFAVLHNVVSLVSNMNVMDYFAGNMYDALGNLALRAAYLRTYGWLRHTSWVRSGRRARFVATQCALVVGTLARYPLMTLARRMQAQVCLAPADRLFSSELHCVQCLPQAGGIAGLYRGICLNLLPLATSATITLLLWPYMQPPVQAPTQQSLAE